MILAHAIALGLVLGFLLFELTGLVAGGLVTPGYFALYFDRPFLMLQALLISAAVLALLRLLARHSILYGRRRFTVAILLGFGLQWLWEALYWNLDLAASRMDALGYIIPGILANEMDRQGIGRTLVSLLLVSCLTRLLLRLLGILP
ncbi:MAG: poly-gamma-glutamate biosynthesis protein PgsC [Deltaproteobacteria bacterium]|nr:poly-gamma-glutamate biosynthesis protein PgsC [Deltaproteobacteria bacterium]